MAQARKVPRQSKLTPEQIDAKVENALRRMLGMEPKFRDIRELSGRKK